MLREPRLGWKRSLQRTVPAVTLLIALLATGVAHQAMDTELKLERGGIFVPEASHVGAATFGFDGLLSDYYWLMVVQLVGGDEGLGELDRTAIGRLIDVVTTLDPWVGHAYRFAAVWLTDTRENVLTANRLLRRGIEHHPTEWRNRHYLGFNHFFYLGDNAAAADILEPVVHLPGAPRYIGGLVAKLRQESSGLENVATFLNGLVASTQDPYARAEYLKALDEVDTERNARVLDHARSLFVERTGRDIKRVDELVGPPAGVLRRLPPAHPNFPDFSWELSEATGEIVSSFYGARYRPHEHATDRQRRARWRQASEVGEL